MTTVTIAALALVTWPTPRGALAALSAQLSPMSSGRQQSGMDVNAFFGALHTSVNIDVPAFHGIEPKLQLSYTSNGDGDGYLGVGWHLGGFMTIERASPGRGAPRYDANDIYLLDGQETVKCAPGMTSPSCTTCPAGYTCYATKIESYLRIGTAGDSWVVWEKDGTKITLNPTHYVGPSTAWKWGVARVEDTESPPNTVTYGWNVNQFGCCWAYPESITYNGTTIKLYWEQRASSDKPSHAIGAGLETIHGRLKSIDVCVKSPGAPGPCATNGAVDSARARAYQLSYTSSASTSRSLLSSAKAFGTDATLDTTGTVTGGTSLPANQFDPTIINKTMGWSTWLTAHAVDLTHRLVLGDFNGDGKQDMMFHFPDGNSWVGISTGSGFNWSVWAFGHTVDLGDRIMVGDFDGDGKSDVFFHYNDGNTWVARSTGSSFTWAIWSTFGAQDTRGRIRIADFNGDGKDDVMFHNKSCYDTCGETCNQWTQTYCQVQQVSFSYWDNNACEFFRLPECSEATSEPDVPTCDGLPAPSQCGSAPKYCEGYYETNSVCIENMPGNGVFRDCELKKCCDRDYEDCQTNCNQTCPGTGEWYVGLSTGSSFVWSNFGTAHNVDLQGRYTVSDFDGDGKSDVMFHWTDGNAWVGRSTGAGFSWGVWANYYAADTNGRVRTGDFNGDGKADVMFHVNDGNAHVGLSTGGAFQFSSWSPLHTVDTSRRMTVGDFNGDGRTDIAFRWDGTGDTWIGLSRSSSFAWEVWSPGLWAGTDTLDRIRSGDFNGDGRSDLLFHLNSGATQVGLGGGAASGGAYAMLPDLLWSEHNPQGGTTSVAYAPSTAWSNTNNGVIVPTVSSVSDVDGRGGVETTFRQYQAGLFDKQERRFLGFHYARVTRSCLPGETSCPYQEAWFHQDYGSISHPSRIDQRDATGALVSTKSYVYATNGATIPYTSVEAESWAYEYAPGGGPCPGVGCQRTLSTQTYDAFGNLTTSYSHGDYDVEGDEKRLIYSFYPNTSAYIVDKLAMTQAKTGVIGSGTLLAQGLAYFDGATAVTTPPTKGNPTRVDKWVDVTNSYVTGSMTYDSFGNRKTMTSERGAVTTFDYDATYHTLLERTTSPLGHAISATHDPVCGVEKTATDPNGLVTTRQYDKLCRPTRVDSPDGGFKVVSYVNTGNPQTQHVQEETPGPAGGSNLWTRKFVDGRGRPWRTQASGGALGDVFQDMSYDVRGNVASETAPYYGGESPKITTIGHDGVDRPVRITHPDGNFRTRSYGLNMTTEVDEAGIQKTVYVDAYDQIVRRREWLGGVAHDIVYTYDLSGHQIGMTDPQGNVWSAFSDSLGRRISSTDPDLGTWTYTYDPANNLTLQVDALGQRTSYGYDLQGRKISKTTRQGTPQAETTTWTYDEARAGQYNKLRPTTMTDVAGSEQYDFDLGGRLARLTRTIDGTPHTFTRGYDTGGRLLGVRYPDGDFLGDDPTTATQETPLGYDSAGRLSSIPGYVSSVGYNARGQATQQANLNGTTTTFAYDANKMWLTDIDTVRAGGGVVQDLAYGRDAVGRITKVASPFCNEGWSYAYDELGRLKSALSHGDFQANQAFEYDLVGNITKNSRLGSYEYASPHGGQAIRPHAVVTAGANAYAYDANGFMTAGAGRSIVWNGDLLPAQVGDTSFVYSGTGTRLKKIAPSGTTLYLGDDYQVTGGVVTKHVALGQRLIAKKEGTAKFWLHTDHLGSVQAVTDASGTTQLRRNHRPYGERLADVGTHQESRGYTGQRLDDEAGLVYMHARYYDPALGRFISPDPIIATESVIQFNRYAYCGNDPINATDTDGLFFNPFKWAKKAFKAVTKAFKAVVKVAKAAFKAVVKVANAIGKVMWKIAAVIASVPFIGGVLAMPLVARGAVLQGDFDTAWRAAAIFVLAATAIAVALIAIILILSGYFTWLGVLLILAAVALYAFVHGVLIGLVQGRSFEGALWIGLSFAITMVSLVTMVTGFFSGNFIFITTSLLMSYNFARALYESATGGPGGMPAARDFDFVGPGKHSNRPGGTTRVGNFGGLGNTPWNFGGFTHDSGGTRTGLTEPDGGGGGSTFDPEGLLCSFYGIC